MMMGEDRRYSIDDLARFSQWPARLLGLERYSGPYEVMVHFEPYYEHRDPSRMTGTLRRRYIEISGLQPQPVVAASPARFAGVHQNS